MFDWIIALMEATGYLGILLLMLAENVFPPIPSELIMPLAGFAAAQGKLALVPVVLAGSAGSLLGAVFWYELGRRVGGDRLKRFAARHGRWLTLSPDGRTARNRLTVKRLGVVVASVDETIRKYGARPSVNPTGNTP